MQLHFLKRLGMSCIILTTERISNGQRERLWLWISTWDDLEFSEYFKDRRSIKCRQSESVFLFLIILEKFGWNNKMDVYMLGWSRHYQRDYDRKIPVAVATYRVPGVERDLYGSQWLTIVAATAIAAAIVGCTTSTVIRLPLERSTHCSHAQERCHGDTGRVS